MLRRTVQIAPSYGGVSTFRPVVDLGLSDRSFTAGRSVEVRLHPSATAEVRDVRFARCGSDPVSVVRTSAEILGGCAR